MAASTTQVYIIIVNISSSGDNQADITGSIMDPGGNKCGILGCSTNFPGKSRET